MKWLLVLGIVSVIGCKPGAEPVAVTPLDGSYLLTTIDGNAVPYTIIMNGEPTSVTAGTLDFVFPNFLAVNLVVESSSGSESRSLSVAGLYRRVTPDSVAFPANASPELFLRRDRRTFIMVTQPRTGVGPAQALGGQHRFTFVEQD